MTHIEELKAKVAELQATIEAMETEAAKPKKFEWKYPYGNTYLFDHSSISAKCEGTTKYLIEHGSYRITKKAAEQSLLRNKRANRLEALAEQLGGLREFVEGERNFLIYRGQQQQWRYSASSFTFEPERVYMTESCAIEICRMLNNNEFSIKGEL